MKKILCVLFLFTATVSAQFVVNPTAIAVSGPAAGTSGTTSISVNWTFQANNTGTAVSAVYDVNGVTATVTCVKSGVGNPRTYTCPASAITLAWATASCGTGTGTDTVTFTASATTNAPAPASPAGGPTTITVNCGTALAINAMQVSALATENGYNVLWDEVQNASRYEVQVASQGGFKTVATIIETEVNVPLPIGGIYAIKINALDADKKVITSKVVLVEKEMPEGYSLGLIYPNPFQQSASFELNVVNNQVLKISIVNVLGQTLKTIFEGEMEAQSLRQFSMNTDGLISGMYFLFVKGETFSAIQPFSVLR